MTNFFDQFDEPVSEPANEANFFDQFDEAPAVEKPSVLRGIAAASTSALARGGSSILDTIQDKMFSTPPIGVSGFSGINKPSVDLDRPEEGTPLDPIINMLRDVGNLESDVIQQARPEGAIKGFAFDAGVALTQMIPSISVGVITKSPNLALAMMGVPAYGNAYEDTLRKGGSKGQAVQDGLVSVFTELGPEKWFGVWEKALGVKSAKDMLRTVALEMFSEVNTEELNVAYAFLKGEDVGSTADLFKRFGHSGLLGAVLGGGMSLPAFVGNKFAGPEAVVPVDEARETIAGTSPAIQEIQKQAEVVPPVPPTPELAPEVAPIKVQPTPTPEELRTEAIPEPEVRTEPAIVEEVFQANEIETRLAEEAAATAAIEAKFANVKRPPELLAAIAGQRIRLDRTKFGGDLSIGGNLQVGNKWLFEAADSGFEGKGPHELRVWMMENGWMNPETGNQPDVVTDHEAVEILNSALRGERIIHPDDAEAELDFLEAQRFAADQAAAESAVIEEFEIDQPITDETKTEIDEIFTKVIESDQLSDNPTDAEIDAFFDGTLDQRAEDGTEQATTEPGRSEGIGISKATPQEELQAAEERKAAERDGLGQDEVAPESGEGELFAGNEPGVRPEQADIEDAIEPEPGEFTTSLKHDVIEEERLARGEEPLLSPAKKSNPETMKEAEAVLTDNPGRADEIIDEVLSGSGDTINAVDSGVLLLEKVRVMNERFKASERASDENLSEDNRLTAQGKWRELEAKIELIEQAARSVGAQFGRNLQFRKVLIRQDFSLAAMEEKARAVRMRPLTPEESTLIKKQADEIANLTRRLEESAQQLQDVADKAKSSQVVSELAKNFADRNVPKSNREWLDRMNQRADDSRAWLKSNMGRTSAGVDPTAYFHLVRVGAAHFANGAVKLTDWVKAMKADLGSRLWGEIEPQSETIFYEAKEQVESEAIEADQPIPTQDEMLYKPTAIESIVLDASTDAAAGLDLTHKTVYELAKAHVLQGVTEESAVMAAVHQDLEPFFPGLTERDIRRAFTEYGEAKFPSEQADKVILRELRVLVRLQESIDRLTERLSPLRTGLQRDKPTKKIRDKQRELNARMKEFESTHPSTSPDRLASVNEARLTRLRNQIADLDEQLKTGKKPEKGKPAEPTPEVIQLTQERDALKEKLRQIEEAKNPPPTAEEKYNITRGKQLRRQFKEVQARLKANDYARRTRPVPAKLNKENQQLAFDLNKAKGDFIMAQYKWELDQATKIRKAFRFTGRLLSFSRSIKTSLDLSETLRQAAIPLFAHPTKIGRINMIAQIKALKSEAVAHALQEQIFNHPKTPFALKAGLFLNRQDAAKPSEREEIYMDAWVNSKFSKLVGISASARAYTVGLNTVRITYFNHLVTTLGRGGQVTEAEAKHIAYWVNISTGRGSLGQFGDTGGTTVFFAPRWVQSRFAVIGGLVNPFGPIFGAPSKRLKVMIANEYARSMAGFTAFAVIIGSAFALAGGDDDEVSFSLDAKSTNFLKIKVGDTRVDLTGAIASPIVFLTRVLGGKKTTQSGKVVPLRGDDVPYGGDTTATILGRYLRSKLAPPIAAGVNLAVGENVVGQKATLRGEAIGLVTTLALSDVYDVLLAQSVPIGTALTIISLLGGATNTYADREAKKEKARRPRTRVKRQRRERR